MSQRRFGCSAGERCFAIAVTMTVLLLPNLISVWVSPGGGVVTAFVFFAGIAWISFAAVAVAGRLSLLWLLALPLVLWLPIELFLLTQYRTTSSAHIFGVILETDYAEAIGFLRGVWVPLLLALAGALAIWGYVMLIFVRQRLAWRGQSRWLFVTLSTCILIVGFVTEAPSQAPSAVEATHADPHESVALPLIGSALYESFPFGVPLRFFAALASRTELRKLAEKRVSRRLGVAPVSGSTKPPVTYVVVIGESSRPDRWELFGGKRKTNPKLSQLANVFTFEDVITPFPATRLSVPLILTGVSPTQDFSGTTESPSLVSAFGEAGYSTYWISAQRPLGRLDGPIGLLAAEAQHRLFLNAGTFSAATPLDDVLIRPLSEILARDEPHQLIVIHTLGSHWDYRKRYPNDFDVFKPSLSDTTEGSLQDRSHKVELVNSYDNSIMFTDHVLSAFIDALKKHRPHSALIYVSDHGQILFDGDCSLAGHGLGTVHDHRVPAFLWMSDGIKVDLGADRIEALLSRRKAKLMSNQVFSTVTDLAGLKWDGLDTKVSWASKEFSGQRRYVFKSAAIDFDDANVSGNCQIVLPKQ